MASMDIAERRLPQDGRIELSVMGRPVDLRVNTVPTVFGECLAIRVLDRGKTIFDMENLGLLKEEMDIVENLIHRPHGIILATGPTGCGKTTTLYALLRKLNTPEVKLITTEDPVEYMLDGAVQVPVKESIGLTFAACIRSILRQDPDIILIGEIRDKETMEIAIKASLTGHLVLSTFHTNDAPSAISRFVYMGLEPYLLASTLNLIVAQRLVRRVCDKCRQPITLSDDIIRRLRLTPEQMASAVFYAGKGCSQCSNTGYRGRMPIFEFLMMDTEIRDAIASGARENQVRSAARAKGYGDLFSYGVSQMLKGLTTAEEVLRVTFSEDS